MADTSREQLLSTLKLLLTSAAYTDLTVTCGPDVYKVHKNIVCSRADFFSRAIKFAGKEAEKGEVDLPEDEPAIVKLLMQYIYEGEYEPMLVDGKVWSSLTPSTTVSATNASPREKTSRKKRSSSPGLDTADPFPHSCHSRTSECKLYVLCPHHNCYDDCRYSCKDFICQICVPLAPPIQGSADQLLIHAKMYEIADKYDVVGLKGLVAEKFSRACQHFWNDAVFAAAAHHVFTTTPDHDKGLRDIVSKTISQHMPELVKKPEVEALLTEFNGLAFGLLRMKTEAGWK